MRSVSFSALPVLSRLATRLRKRNTARNIGSMAVFAAVILILVSCAQDPLADFDGAWEVDLRASLEARRDPGGRFRELIADGGHIFLTIDVKNSSLNWEERSTVDPARGTDRFGVESYDAQGAVLRLAGDPDEDDPLGTMVTLHFREGSGKDTLLMDFSPPESVLLVLRRVR